MIDLTLPILGLTTLVGYFFSQNRTERTQTEIRTITEKNEQPTGNTIYESNKLEEVNREMLERSLVAYKKAENPAKTGVLPPLYNTYSAVGSDLIMSPETNFDITSTSSLQQSEIYDTNRLKDITQTTKTSIVTRPMFSNMLDQPDERNYIEYLPDGSVEIDQQKSLLTGLSINTTHNNMIPFFGSATKQNIEQFTNDPILDLYTGNTSTFKHKNEVGKFFPERQENIYGTPIFTTSVNQDRYIPSLYKQNEKPFDDARVAAPISGTINNNIRPGFKDVNELRVGNRLQKTYEGRTVAGQMGEVRGYQSNIEKQRPDTYYEQGQEQLLKTTGDFTAHKLNENFSNMQPTNRKDYNLEYIGTSSSIHSKNKQRVTRDSTAFDSVMQDPKRLNFKNEYSRNITGNRTTTDYGKSGITMYENERLTTEDKTQLINLSKSTAGIRTHFGDSPRNTIKETTLDFDNSGNVNTSYNNGKSQAFNNGVSGVSAPSTHKQSTITNNYKGGINKEDGMGYLVSKYDAKTTGKELISEQSDYTGVAQNNVKNTAVYNAYNNAEIRDTKEIIAKRNHNSGPQKFQISASKNIMGDTQLTNNMLLKEQEDRREPKNLLLPQIIKSKNSIGIKTQFRYDDEKVDTVFADRLQPDLVTQQHSQNPFSLYGK